MGRQSLKSQPAIGNRRNMSTGGGDETNNLLNAQRKSEVMPFGQADKQLRPDIAGTSTQKFSTRIYMNSKIDNLIDKEFVPIQNIIHNPFFAHKRSDTESNSQNLYGLNDGGTRLSNFRSQATSGIGTHSMTQQQNDYLQTINPMPTIHSTTETGTFDRSAMRSLQFRQQHGRYNMMQPSITKVSSPQTTKVEIAATFNGRLRGSMQYNSVGNRTASTFRINPNF